jgi:hypothetical protein
LKNGKCDGQCGIYQGTVVAVDKSGAKDVLSLPKPLALSLWQTSDATSYFEKVADSLTTYIRNVDNTLGNSSGYVEGSTQQWTVHYRIDWPFLATPAAAVLLGSAYVIAVVLESRRLPVWKESVYPTLVYELDEDNRTKLRETFEKGELGGAENKAKRAVVRLENDGGFAPLI